MKAYKSKVKRLRLTEEQVLRIDNYLSKHDLNFSEFVIHLIEQTISKEPIQLKKKISRSPLKIDHALSGELGRIGNNINQISKSLNIIRQDPSNFDQFSFLQCFTTLVAMQNDLHDCLKALKIGGQ